MTAEAWNKADRAFRHQLLAEISATPAQCRAILTRDWQSLPRWAKRKLKTLAHYFPARDLTEHQSAPEENR